MAFTELEKRLAVGVLSVICLSQESPLGYVIRALNLSYTP
jgi:hypothetical protein